MTKKIDNVILIEEEKAQQCDDCGEVKELRPYGPNGTCICFECAMKDEEGTKQRFYKFLEGE